MHREAKRHQPLPQAEVGLASSSLEERLDLFAAGIIERLTNTNNSFQEKNDTETKHPRNVKAEILCEVSKEDLAELFQGLQERHLNIRNTRQRLQEELLRQQRVNRDSSPSPGATLSQMISYVEKIRGICKRWHVRLLKSTHCLKDATDDYNL